MTKFAAGVVVPIPTLPVLSMVILVVSTLSDGAVLKCKLPTLLPAVRSNVMPPPGTLLDP